jgi:hypothetical protein
MADRDLVHQPANAGGGLETGARPFDPPLLPYEVALIEALDCTEQEYRQFVRHAQLQARVRPAEYAHIPDVVNDPVSIIVSLVIGVALSAVSTSCWHPRHQRLNHPPRSRAKSSLTRSVRHASTRPPASITSAAWRNTGSRSRSHSANAALAAMVR